ncbi:MAG: hypothetical protein V4503_08080 [Gemmatimonadota bacterium]
MSSEADRKSEMNSALAEVLSAQRTSEGELRAHRVAAKGRSDHPRFQPGLLFFVLIAWGFIAYAWVARPDFLFGTGPTPVLTVQQREARMRYAIYLERARVEQFRANSGRLPETLLESGPVEAGVQYERLANDRYDVSGSVDGTLLRLGDRMSADSFLGDALRTLPPAQ